MVNLICLVGIAAVFLLAGWVARLIVRSEKRDQERAELEHRRG
jgi:putative effector of murein hydrolase LrgA (UPF0299 family)